MLKIVYYNCIRNLSKKNVSGFDTFCERMKHQRLKRSFERETQKILPRTLQIT